MTQAAAKSGASQPGLSRTMRDLEMKLNTRLLQRTGRGVELTKAGQVFFEFCTQTLTEYQKSKLKINKLSRSLPSQLDIAVPLRTSSLLTPVLLRTFQKHLPDINVYIYEETSQRIADDVMQGVRDVGLVYQPPVSATIYPLPLANESLCLVGTVDKIGPADSPINLMEVTGLPLLLPSRELHYRRLIDLSLQKTGSKPNVIRELETVDALLAFAMEGEGVTILPYSNVYQQVQRKEIAVRKIKNPVINRTVSLILNKEIDRFAAAKIKKYIKQSVTQICASYRWAMV